MLRHPHSQLSHIRPTPCNAFKRVQWMELTTRYFSLTAGRHWANKKARVSPDVKSTAKTVVPDSLPPKGYVSFADTLARRSSPILLYQAPSHTVYIAGCWLLGGFCMTWATFNFYSQYLDPAKGTPTWIPVLIGGVCVVMVCMGTWAILGVRISTVAPFFIVDAHKIVGLPYHSQYYCSSIFF